MKKGEKTRKKIISTYYEISSEQEEDVTVQQICDRLDIYRSTFYNYFSSIAELEETIFGDLISYDDSTIYFTRQVLFNRSLFYENVYKIAVFLKENRDNIYIILNSKKAQSLKDSLDNMIKNELQTILNMGEDAEISFLMDFLSSGIMAAFDRWIKNDEMTPAEFADFIVKTVGGAAMAFQNHKRK